MVALYPGAHVPAAMIDAHPVGRGGDGEVLAVHLTRYPLYDADTPEELPESLRLHLAVMLPERWEAIEARIPADAGEEYRKRLHLQWVRQDTLATNASAVVTRAGDRPALLVLDETMRRHPGASAVGVLVDHASCLVGLRTDHRAADTRGYAVMMTAAAQSGPLALYASALLGWSQWWLDRADEVSDRPVSPWRLPPPPLEIDVVEAWTAYRVHVHEHERVRWPPTPHRPAPEWLVSDTDTP
jgi:hypothetical protein